MQLWIRFNRVLSFYPVEVRPTMLGDLAAALRAVVSQRLLRSTSGGRIPAVELLLNTKLVSELIEKGDFSGQEKLYDGSNQGNHDSSRGDRAFWRGACFDETGDARDRDYLRRQYGAAVD